MFLVQLGLPCCKVATILDTSANFSLGDEKVKTCSKLGFKNAGNSKVGLNGSHSWAYLWLYAWEVDIVFRKLR